MTDAPDYRDTVFLPKTDFPMKAGLANKEPAILAKWAADDLYGKLRETRAGKPRFILHDGPPYANGDIHMGHAMNKVLKDIIVRSQSLTGKDAPYVPGWDCHGLPIEWKVEEAYRAKKLNKDEVDPVQFRAECRAYAEKWVGVQKEQFKRLGVQGDWDDPYLTMNYASEAAIVGELLKFAESGQLYRGAKPVMWSPVEKTALAEAEVEYEDITSTQIDVAFEIVESKIPELVGAYAVIWTTTPWTIPVNQALAYGPEVEYTLVELDGRKLLVSFDPALLRQIALRLVGAADHEAWLAAQYEKIVPFKGSDLAGTIARHPMHKLGGFYAKPRPLLAGDFVTTDAGTGLVHMAPDHGEDDFLLCKEHGIAPVFAVEGDGKYRADWEWLAGQGSVINPKFNAPDGPICADLRETGALLAASADFKHSYPHSWRSKAKVIFRCTPQWFIPMDKPIGDGLAPRCGEEEAILKAQGNGATLRDLALGAIQQTRWVPEKGENRITSMVAGRPDWVISRQRAWGVPIAVYVNSKTGDYLRDPAVNARIVAAFEAGGADAWFTADHQDLLGSAHDAADYEPVNDILDVWFDSGCTHAFTVEARYGIGTRADLYLEGSDQHRGWFQSSLLESCGTRGRAPYDAVLTHGFALDGQGRKMSKSQGNVVDPLKIINESGADILRLWVASTDYFEDVRIGKEILAGTSDAYRKLRNTFRYLLGALDGYSDAEKVAPAEMPELERYVLHLLASLDAELKDATAAFEFNRYARALSEFANNDLSAFFFDIRKDSLYCDAPSDPKRRAYRTVLDTLFHALVRYAAPILCFTAEEVWGTRFPDAGSVHLLTWPEVDAGWKDDDLRMRWELLRRYRVKLTGEIEPLRREKVIGSSLEVEVTALSYDAGEAALLRTVDLAELGIVAKVEVCEGDAAVAELAAGSDPIAFEVAKTEYEKCGRCWRHLPEVASDGTLCGRCETVVHG
ncbi:isoleucine--tRNA ligase [Rhizorhabdus dicambivorans]|uniref:Isoleucine--tRNA ligase n=1 Tax=Rhizorhabdus dicambivorans TaxID=1850238 RepID=A0A2A4FVH9_9SPHN|nr:isoleucine--tRNA ligase [Rhizorhabdus dicambivorans]ATE66946.1 isoleucine--tRNA ligase [Rhizorhabdus dicambivorans]PCE42181.1 isoleucine--tRNA ligase [Rhizorhabdus dicambivorans]